MVNHQKPTIALFGGSFDPPHKGHQLIVEKAIENLQIDKLFVVPAYLNPFKTSTLADAPTRLAWCHTLFDSIARVSVDDYEIKEGKSTVTSQSVKHFNQAYNVKYLIIGSDNLSTLTKWHAFEWLNETVTWVIATRGNHHLDTDELNKWELLPIEAPMSSTQIREEKDLQIIDKKIRTSVKHILEGQNNMTIDERIANIVNILDDKKAEEI
ncbi:MAG: nicotinate (nicotinamide) nucleotide adenylyltransferase [Sulfurovum sp.]